ncbi:MAG TPA: hypothetical protein VFR12_09995, partial [Pyrinomonadaceae bacterium]|nr:hypothetical protein [Pyrinomonadaceae bacterium]
HRFTRINADQRQIRVDLRLIIGLVIRTLGSCFRGHGFRFTGHLAATLPAQVTIVFLYRGHEPETAARLAQDC